MTYRGAPERFIVSSASPPSALYILALCCHSSRPHSLLETTLPPQQKSIIQTNNTSHHRPPPTQSSPACIAHTLCASRVRQLRRRSRTHRLRRRRPRAAVCSERPALVCLPRSSDSRSINADMVSGHTFRKSVHVGAFGPDLAKKLSQLVKMEKNVMRSMELVGRERMEVAVRNEKRDIQWRAPS